MQSHVTLRQNSKYAHLTAPHQKPQETIKYDVTQHHVDIQAMLWWVISPFK